MPLNSTPVNSAFTVPGTGPALRKHQFLLRTASGEAQIKRDEGTGPGVSLKPS